VEFQNYLGIYISKETATAVCINSQDENAKVVGCFSVRAEDRAEASPRVLASLISQGCSEREWGYSEVSVGLDCAMFMQHNVHSEFGDAKQIAATIRFDTEEALAMDVSDIAIAFQITSSNESGSELTVFTAQKKVLSDILISLQSGGMDPVSIEPDVNCLSRFVCRKLSASKGTEGGTLFGMLSVRSGYLIVPHQDGSGSQKASRVRTFLVGSTTDRNGLLAREAIMTTALSGGGEPISCLRVFDSAGAVDYQQFGERLGVEADEVDLVGLNEADEQLLVDCADRVDFAIAYGAALGHFAKAPAVNFRDDFMPYQGKKLRLQKALKYFSVSVTVLLIAAGLYFQTRLFNVSKYRDRVRGKFAADYSAVMRNKPLSRGVTIKRAVDELDKEKRKIEKNPGIPGINTDDISSKLTLVFDAFNKSIAQTKLEIEKVSIAARNVVITGYTSSRSNTDRFFDTVRRCGLDIVSERLDTERGRDKFSITVVPRKK